MNDSTILPLTTAALAAQLEIPTPTTAPEVAPQREVLPDGTILEHGSLNPPPHGLTEGGVPVESSTDRPAFTRPHVERLPNGTVVTHN